MRLKFDEGLTNVKQKSKTSTTVQYLCISIYIHSSLPIRVLNAVRI